MQQYIYEDHYRGKNRQLLILVSADTADYRVFHESSFLGSIQRAEPDNQTSSWKTEYNMLKPIAAKIGAYIVSCEDA